MLKVGLLSFAHFHQEHWAAAFQADRRVSLAGIWDADPERLERMSARFGLKAFARAEELLAVCDAAAVCSETSQHPRLVELCCLAGVQILCEKPSAVSLEEGRTMKAMIEKSGIIFYQSFPQRHIPSNIRIKELLAAGALGRVTHVRKRHGHYFGLEGLHEKMPWLVDPAGAGGGALLDEGVHETFLLDWFFGRPLSVTAELAFHAAYPAETSGAAIYRYPGDLLCVLECGWNWRAGGPTTEIYGERGAILQYRTDCASNVAGEGWPQLAHYDAEAGAWTSFNADWDFASIHAKAPADFVSVLLEGRKPPTGIDAGLAAQEMIEGAYRAASLRRTVDFPLGASR